MNLLVEIESARLDEPSANERVILRSAMASFARKGYAATTLRSIAAEAGVTAPMVSYYFKSKENLFLKIAEIVMASVETEVARALDTSNGFPEAIRAIARAHVALVDRSPSAVQFMLAMLYGPQEGQPQPDVDRMYAATGRRIAETFERGIRSGELELREGVTVPFLVDHFASLIHDSVVRRFRRERLLERYPERREEIESRLGDGSLELALEHFFFGAGAAPGLASH
jgi:AcrR family transcriptional regulator